MAKKNAFKWNKVTPFSKYLAMALFIIIPFVTFYIGTRYPHSPDTQEQQVQHFPLSQLSPNKLLISRPENKYDNLPALTQTITDEKIVKQLYDEIYLLPPPPPGRRSCPMVRFVEYNLEFFQDNKQIMHALLKPTGCATVKLGTGEIKDALNINGKKFISDLEQVIQLSNESNTQK